MENSNDTIGNRTRDPPTCSAVRQPTAPPCASLLLVVLLVLILLLIALLLLLPTLILLPPPTTHSAVVWSQVTLEEIHFILCILFYSFHLRKQGATLISAKWEKQGEGFNICGSEHHAL